MNHAIRFFSATAGVLLAISFGSANAGTEEKWTVPDNPDAAVPHCFATARRLLRADNAKCLRDYETDADCEICGGVRQPLTGTCLPGNGNPPPGQPHIYIDPDSGQVTVIRHVYECLLERYEECLQRAITAFRIRTAGCRKPPSTVEPWQGPPANLFPQ